MIKLYIHCSETEKAKIVKAYVLDQLRKEDILESGNISDSEGIIVIGGDGEMLRAIHQFYEYKIPFIGVNSGGVGFLMNDSFSTNLLPSSTLNTRIQLYPLEMLAFLNDKLEKKLAFNEVSVHRDSNQAAKLSVSINDITYLEELVSDGIIVSTPAGSSAYNLSAGGRIVPLESNVLCITPVCPYRPRRWNGAIIPDNSYIKLNSIESLKRPINAVADFNEIHNVKSIEIKLRKDIYAEVIFSSIMALNERLIKEQFMV